MLNIFGEVESVEFDTNCSIYSSENKNIRVCNASVASLPFKSSTFDLVCAFDVLEHVQNDNIAVKEIFRVCKKNGHVFVTVPAYEFLWSEHDEVNQHFRRYNKNNLQDLFKTQENNTKYYTLHVIYVFVE